MGGSVDSLGRWLKDIHTISAPVASTDQLSTGIQIVDRIKELLEAAASAPTIADQLNAEGLKTSRGKPFTETRVRMLMMKNGLRSKKQKAVPCDNLAKDEWRIVDLMNETNLSYSKIHRLIQVNRIAGRKGKMGRWIVTVDSQMLQELKKHPKTAI